MAPTPPNKPVANIPRSSSNNQADFSYLQANRHKAALEDLSVASDAGDKVVRNFSFGCAGCGDDAIVDVPVSIFLEALIDIPVAETFMGLVKKYVDKFRAVGEFKSSNGTPKPQAAPFFGSQQLLDIGQKLVREKVIPVNPFAVYSYGQAKSSPEVLEKFRGQAAACLGKPVDSVVEKVEPEVEVKKVEPETKTEPEVKPETVKIEEGLSVKATLKKVGDDKNLAKVYLEAEEKSDKPRVSLLKELKKRV